MWRGWSPGTLLLLILGGSLVIWGAGARIAWLILKLTHPEHYR
jgi:hypothetical protein